LAQCAESVKLPLMTARSISEILRALPSVNALLRADDALALRPRIGEAKLTALARRAIDELRDELQQEFEKQKNDGGNKDDKQTNVIAHNRNSTTDNRQTADKRRTISENSFTRDALLAEAARRLMKLFEREEAKKVRHVINATGVILHTNLGRAPLSNAARRAVAEEAARYCALEFDLTAGRRGRRGARVEQLLVELTGAEDALVTNNCAAAAVLVLSVLARDGETIVSRGELVEIGGDFRVPDVLAASGTRMIEVGTTNRTRLSDYERAINERTRLILRAHQSNFRIVGFTSTPSLAQLAALARRRHLPLFEDAGSGAMLNLSEFGLNDEPLISDSIKQGADVVSFSGDKLLGGAQAGLIVGRAEIIERLRRAPLYRALRPDKLTLAALDATLEAYARGAAQSEIPVLMMLAQTRAEIEKRARLFVRKLRRARHALHLDEDHLCFEVIAGESAIGGGAAPLTHPPTALIALKHETLAADALEAKLRAAQPPVIARIQNERVCLDLRTVAKDEEAVLWDILVKI
jgi:L-seryl-tRNA(Ser) seleniumtransferase